MVKLKMMDSSNKIELGQTKWFEIGQKMKTLSKSLYSSSERSTKLVTVKYVRQEINTNPLGQKQN